MFSEHWKAQDGTLRPAIGLLSKDGDYLLYKLFPSGTKHRTKHIVECCKGSLVYPYEPGDGRLLVANKTPFGLETKDTNEVRQFMGEEVTSKHLDGWQQVLLSYPQEVMRTPWSKVQVISIRKPSE